MAQACPNCGGFDISQEADRYHCLNCGNYFTYDHEEAKDGPGEPLFHPEERTVEAEPQREPTDHAAIAAESQTGSEGIDSAIVLDQEPTAGQTSAEKAPSPTPEAAPASEIGVESGEAVSEPTQEAPQQ